MHRRWIDPPLPSPEAEELAHRVGVARLTGQLLWERGARDEDAARRFLDPNLDCLHDPLLLPDADRAVERLARAVRERERILVHGDYDVDGVCAAALLTRTLRVLQADVDHFVPHRRVQGYDLQVETVRERAAQGIRLIVTADCGIVAFAGAEAARDLGVDLIVTDHHEPDGGGRLPVACAVVNPKRPGSRYPFPDLCGTAVAYKLCLALLDRLQVPSAGFRTRFLDLVALATCADCMPLLDENRVLVKHGLESIRNTNKAGLKALMQNSGLRADRLNTRALGFALGPRINAIGRMDDAAVALELLLTSDAAEAENLAQRLEQANRDRQQEQEQIYQDAIRQSQRYLDDRILVLSSPRWHPGIIGIVASRVVENCFRPAVLIAVDEATGRARGSCRSLGDYNIFAALQACGEHLNHYGGHAAAAGFDMEPGKIAALREALRRFSGETLPEAMLQPAIQIDAEVSQEELGLPLARELQRLEPFGHGNHQPVLLSRGLQVTEQRRLAGRTPNGPAHLRLRIGRPHPSGRPVGGVSAVFWRAWNRAGECPVGGAIDACFNLEVNEFQGARSAQLALKDLRPVGEHDKPPTGDDEFLDHWDAEEPPDPE